MGELPFRASTAAGAVFLSYASQDAEAAQKICDALRAAGVEVWFDRSELRGGDAWDQSIRKQIKTCALFVPIISQHTHERAEGYFRLEWKLAVDRSHLIMANKAFLVPVVIDDTADDDENVPERFREVQWTRLPGGAIQPEFVARIKRLLSPDPPITARSSAGATPGSSPISLTTRTPSTSRRAVPVAVAVLFVAALGYLLINKPWLSKPTVPPVTSYKTSSPAPTTAFAPPPHSIAVLPFVNMSGSKEQEYFSDGLTEELLNSLSRINELQVAARTSSFSFQGEHPDISTVAHKLNVASVLEGSVRRSGRTVRVTAQLINAVTGFHTWSQTYDRDLGDLLKMQTEIATAVASALKVTLLGDEAAKIELGGTHNPAAFDAYLRGFNIYMHLNDFHREEPAIAAYTEAVRLDPNYALAYAMRSTVLLDYAETFPKSSDPKGSDVFFDRAHADAQRAVNLAPELAEGHLALARFLELRRQDWRRASEEYEEARALAPGSARVLRIVGSFYARNGRTDDALAVTRRAITLDPINPKCHDALGYVLYLTRRYEEAITAYKEAMALDPRDEGYYEGKIGLTHYALSRLEEARSSCEKATDYGGRGICLAIVYRKLGRNAEAQEVLTKLQASWGDTGAYPYAMIYAQWGEIPKAISSLGTAVRLRDGDLAGMRVDPLLDPIRNEPDFEAFEKRLNLPP